MAANELRRRVHALSVRAAQLEGVRRAAVEQNERLTSDVAKAKGRMALGEEVARVLDAMQQRAHERSVGSLEVLLSAILQDVLPDEGTVRLLPQYKSNSTHLDIALQKGDYLEDVLDGNGGAVANVVSAGLRFAALVRTKNRRLMALDEPDCWLKPERVPAFVQTLAQVSQQTGAQTFFITHHNPAFFEGHFNLVRFTTDADGRVTAKPLMPQLTTWLNDEEPGIRAIELFNVRRHEHTVVPCYPGATAYIGDNNLGKSTALLSALRVVAYGESDDSLIRHGCEEARIILHLERGQRIEWSRHIKRSPAVIYKLFRGDELVAEGRPKTRNQTPEWVNEVLRVARVDELDIQVGNQKCPVFLLDETAPRRAQILSVGKESSYLKELMRGYEEIKGADREVIKQGELTLARLKLRLTYLTKLEPVHERMQKLVDEAEALLKALENEERRKACLARVQAADLAASRLEEELKVLQELPEAPHLQDVASIAKAIAAQEKSAHVTKIGALPELPVVPSLQDLAELARLGAAIGRAQKALKALPAGDVPCVPAAPELKDCSPLRLLMEKLTAQDVCVKGAQADYESLNASVAQEEAQLERIKEEIGGDCPLCGSPFASKEHETHQHVH